MPAPEVPHYDLVIAGGGINGTGIARDAAGRGLKLSAADPLNLEGILTPQPRVPSQARRRILVA